MEIEERLSDQEQYTRRECVVLVGLTTDLHGGQLEDYFVEVFQTTGVEVNKFSRNPLTEKQETSKPARCREYFERKEVAELGRRQ